MSAREYRQTAPVYPAFFLESQAMYIEERDRVLPPLTVCAACGGDLLMTRSGHHFCANAVCRDGFDVRPGFRLAALVSLLEKKTTVKKLCTQRLDALTEADPKKRASLLRLVAKEEAKLIPAKSKKPAKNRQSS